MVRDAGSEAAAVWVELAVPDIQAATAFYSQLFGWRCDGVVQTPGHYATACIGRRPVAGLLRPEVVGFDVLWTVFVSARDVAGTVEAAVQRGATVLVPPVLVADFGQLAERTAVDDRATNPWLFPGSDLAELATMAVVADPSGASVGLWHWRGRVAAAQGGDPGALVGAEHLSLDPESAEAFYRGLPGWGHSDQTGPEFRRVPDDLADLAPLWVPRFGVADVRQTVQRAVGLGGREVSLVGSEDLPAIVVGQSGEVFGLATVGHHWRR